MAAAVTDVAVLDRRRTFVVLLWGLVASAWLALVLWDRSPYGRFLSHDDLGEGADAGVVLLFVAGWTLMTVAMMLPTSVPLVNMFQVLTRRRPDRRRLVAMLVVGYLGMWMVFGALVHVADQGVHRLVEQVAWLDARPWVIGAAILLVAGAYQFSALKYRCLEQCRSPYSFITQHWRGSHEALEAFRLGVHHGAFCIGCCWSLMLLMFAVGVGNVGWMLVLGTVMAVEKNLRWGRRLSRPLGAALLGSAALVVLTTTSLAG